MSEDDELKKIRHKKLQELMKKVRDTKMKNESSGKPVKLTDSSFNDAIQNSPLVVIDCWAPWCGPCNIVTPIIEELASDYAGKILFGKLNVDENRTTAIKYEIMSIPTLLVFKTGKLVDRIIGAMPKALLEPKITQYL